MQEDIAMTEKRNAMDVVNGYYAACNDGGDLTDVRSQTTSGSPVPWEASRARTGSAPTPPCAGPDQLIRRPQPNTPSGSYFFFTRRTRSRLPPQ
jgi:hypothetical protein